MPSSQHRESLITLLSARRNSEDAERIKNYVLIVGDASYQEFAVPENYQGEADDHLPRS